MRFIDRSETGRRRLRRWEHGLLVVLLAHAVLVYAWPDFALLTRGGARWLLGLTPSSVGGRPHEKTLTIDGRLHLWGGDRIEEHFDISEFRLDPDQLHFGLGREHFNALIRPEFMSMDEVGNRIGPKQRVLVASINGETHVYPLSWMRRHEVVNDVVGGRPVFAAYCPLAELGAVYDRVIDGRPLVFGVSGYTYRDVDVWDGFDAFVLWDRNTESLWWPPIGTAVSGELIDTPMQVLDETLWAQTTWEKARFAYPDAVVLRPGQDGAELASVPWMPGADRPVPAARRPADPDAPVEPRPRVAGEGRTTPSASIPPPWGANGIDR
jgi:hypothetical protein